MTRTIHAAQLFGTAQSMMVSKTETTTTTKNILGLRQLKWTTEAFTNQNSAKPLDGPSSISTNHDS